jgi:hypothetical protein
MGAALCNGSFVKYDDPVGQAYICKPVAYQD